MTALLSAHYQKYFPINFAPLLFRNPSFSDTEETRKEK